MMFWQIILSGFVLFFSQAGYAFYAEPYISYGQGNIEGFVAYDGTIEGMHLLGLRLGLYQQESLSVGIDYSRGKGHINSDSIYSIANEFESEDVGLFLSIDGFPFKAFVSYFPWHRAQVGSLYEGIGYNMGIGYSFTQNVSADLMYYTREETKNISVDSAVTSTNEVSGYMLAISFPYR